MEFQGHGLQLPSCSPFAVNPADQSLVVRLWIFPLEDYVLRLNLDHNSMNLLGSGFQHSSTVLQEICQQQNTLSTTHSLEFSIHNHLQAILTQLYRTYCNWLNHDSTKAMKDSDQAYDLLAMLRFRG